MIAADHKNGNARLGELCTESVQGKTGTDALLFTVGEISRQHKKINVLLKTEIFQARERREGCLVQLLRKTRTIGHAL